MHAHIHVCRPALHVGDMPKSCKTDATQHSRRTPPPSRVAFIHATKWESGHVNTLAKVEAFLLQSHIVTDSAKIRLLYIYVVGLDLLSLSVSFNRHHAGCGCCQARCVSVSRQHRCSEQSLQQEADDDDEDEDDDSMAPAMVPSGCVTCCPMMTGRSMGTAAAASAPPAAPMHRGACEGGLDGRLWFSATQRSRSTGEEHCETQRAQLMSIRRCKQPFQTQITTPARAGLAALQLVVMV